jgi:hypothetical protein
MCSNFLDFGKNYSDSKYQLNIFYHFFAHSYMGRIMLHKHLKRKFIRRTIILKGRCLPPIIPFQIVGSPFLKGEWAFERTNSPVLRVNKSFNYGTYSPLERANLFVRKPIYHSRRVNEG